MTGVRTSSITSPVASGVTQRLPLLLAAALPDGSGIHGRRGCSMTMQDGAVSREIAALRRMFESRRLKR